MCDRGLLLDPTEGVEAGGENLGGQTCASVMGEGWTGTLSCNNLDTPVACRFNKTDCAAPEIYGCMNDVNACNYDSDVTIDDESCYGPYDCDDYGGCGGSSVCDTEVWCSDFINCADYGGCGPSETCSTGVCGESFDCTSGAYGDIYGCGSTDTCFVSDCSSPDQCGVCDGDGSSCEEPVGGCTNSNYCNYNSNADFDDGSCECTSCCCEYPCEGPNDNLPYCYHMFTSPPNACSTCCACGGGSGTCY
jgi:hypothetical protein